MIESQGYSQEIVDWQEKIIHEQEVLLDRYDALLETSLANWRENCDLLSAIEILAKTRKR